MRAFRRFGFGIATLGAGVAIGGFCLGGTSDTTTTTTTTAASTTTTAAGTTIAPGDSLNTALSNCTSGTITMSPGSYAGETITANSPCTVSAAGATVTSNESFQGSGYTIDGLTIDVGSSHSSGANIAGSNITLKTLNLHGAYVRLDIRDSTNVTWDGGELGQQGVTPGKRWQGDAEPVVVQASSNVTISHVTFWPQDFDSTAYAGSSNGFHLEMIRLDSSLNGFTLSSSSFPSPQNNNTAAVFITDTSGTGDPTNLVFVNNFFGTDSNTIFSVSAAAVQTCSAWTFAYNTLLDTPGDITSASVGCATETNVVFVGNIGPRPGFYSCSATFIKNVWEKASGGAACGTDTEVIGTQYATDKLGLTGDGFHLASNSVARGAGETTYCASTAGSKDHDGDVRPNPSGSCDAGGDEVA